MSEHIDQLTNAQLDEAVAREVMRWTVPKNVGETLNRDGWIDDSLGPPIAVTPHGAWHPSTDISAAWQVAKQMRKLGFDFIPHANLLLFTEPDDAPRMICRQALKALRSTVPADAGAAPREAR